MLIGLPLGNGGMDPYSSAYKMSNKGLGFKV